MMLQQKFLSKVIPRVPNLLKLIRINSFSDTGSKDKEGQSFPPPDTANSEQKSPKETEELSQLLKDAAAYNEADDPSWATTPYPEGAPSSVQQEKKEIISPLDKSVIIFPGQGTLKVGTVTKYLKFPDAKELFEIANEVLGYDLLKLCMQGPQEKLNRTVYNQPATVVASLAALDQLREERPRAFDNCVGTAGYSVGELTSMIFSGVIPFEDGIRLAGVRGAAMQQASSLAPQGMLSAYFTPEAKTTEVLNSAKNWALDCGVPEPVCSIAIYLCTQTKIIGGHAKALEYIQTNSKQLGLRKLQRLPVSGAFHTQLMEPALKSFVMALKEIELEEPRVHVYSNVTGKRHGNLKSIPKRLVQQIVRPVKWEQVIQGLYERPPGMPFPRTFDVGSEGRMKTILRLINSKAADSCFII